MALKGLSLAGLRCIERAELDPAPGRNLVIGNNASGKTSLLEAIFLLGRGRSFRAARREAMVRDGQDALRVVGKLKDGRSLGIEVTRSEWRARAGGETVTQLAELASLLPVQLLDPEVHRLVQEGPGERRRYLDWATFHVEQGFLEAWRAYQRALRQRNSALRTRQPDAVLAVWEQGLAEHGELIDRYRRATVEQLQPAVAAVGRRLLGGDLGLEYRAGQAEGQSLEAALAQHRERDRRIGMTQVGPHRADLAVVLDAHRARGWVSRGQQKLVAAAMVLGQAQLLVRGWDDRAVLLVDDPAAELDPAHCAALMEVITELPCQSFLTVLPGTELPGLGEVRRFHVEQGRVEQVV